MPSGHDHLPYALQAFSGSSALLVHSFRPSCSRAGPRGLDETILCQNESQYSRSKLLSDMSMYLCPFPPLLSLCLAVLTTILVCWYFVLGNASRSALAALIIVFIQENEAGNWSIALERMGSVIIGCLVALILTMLFHYAGKILSRRKETSP